MFLAFLDEADHTSRNNFTVCGLTAVSLDKAADLHQSIERHRNDIPEFGPTNLLKSSNSSRPENLSIEKFTQLKNDIMKAGVEKGAVFMGYVFFNSTPTNQPDRNRTFGFNTLLSNYNKFLEQKNEYGIVIYDRLQFESGGNDAGYEYIRSKFQVGNEHRGNQFKPLSRILSHSMCCEGASHISALNDIYTGGLRYVANGGNQQARESIRENLLKAMWKSEQHKYLEHGLSIRPRYSSRLPADIRAEYDNLENFLRAGLPSSPH